MFMKRTLLTVLALTMLICFAECSKDSQVYLSKEGKPVKVADYLYLYEKTGKYPDFGCGTERYDILKENYEKKKNTMDDMYELLKMVQYTHSYKMKTTPFWCSEFYDKIGKIDGKPVNAKTPREKIINDTLVQRQIVEYEKYERSKGKSYNDKAGLWFTTHNTTYDIENRRMWVTIREHYESRYEFQL